MMAISWERRTDTKQRTLVALTSLMYDNGRKYAGSKTLLLDLSLSLSLSLSAVTQLTTAWITYL